MSINIPEELYNPARAIAETQNIAVEDVFSNRKTTTGCSSAKAIAVLSCALGPDPKGNHGPLFVYSDELRGRFGSKYINTELRSIVVLNAADPFGRDNDEAAAIICEKEDFEYFPHPIIRRKAFRNAAAAGLSVLEHGPTDEKAVHEFGLFAAHIFGYSGDIASISPGHHKESLAQDKDERQAG